MFKLQVLIIPQSALSTVESSSCGTANTGSDNAADADDITNIDGNNSKSNNGGKNSIFRNYSSSPGPGSERALNAISTPIPPSQFNLHRLQSYNPTSSFVAYPNSFVSLPSNQTHNIRTKKFLHITYSRNRLETIAQEISQRFLKLYPNEEPLHILNIQDYEECDLDPDYTAEMVFDNNNICRVIVANEFNESDDGIINSNGKRHLAGDLNSVMKKVRKPKTLKHNIESTSLANTSIWSFDEESRFSKPHHSSASRTSHSYHVLNKPIGMKEDANASHMGPNISLAIPDVDDTVIHPHKSEHLKIASPIVATGSPTRITSGMLNANSQPDLSKVDYEEDLNSSMYVEPEGKRASVSTKEDAMRNKLTKTPASAPVSKATTDSSFINNADLSSSSLNVSPENVAIELKTPESNKTALLSMTNKRSSISGSSAKKNNKKQKTQQESNVSIPLTNAQKMPARLDHPKPGQQENGSTLVPSNGKSVASTSANNDTFIQMNNTDGKALEKAAKEKAAKERAAKEKAEKAKEAKEKAAKEKAEKAEKAKEAKEKAAKERAEKAEKAKAAKEKAAKEKAKAAKEKAEKDKAEEEKAEKEKAEKEKAKAAKEKAEKDKAEEDKAEEEKAEKEKAAKEKAEKEKADKEKVAREKVAKDRLEKEKLAKEREQSAESNLNVSSQVIPEDKPLKRSRRVSRNDDIIVIDGTPEVDKGARILKKSSNTVAADVDSDNILTDTEDDEDISKIRILTRNDTPEDEKLNHPAKATKVTKLSVSAAKPRVSNISLASDKNEVSSVGISNNLNNNGESSPSNVSEDSATASSEGSPANKQRDLKKKEESSPGKIISKIIMKENAKIINGAARHDEISGDIDMSNILPQKNRVVKPVATKSTKKVTDKSSSETDSSSDSSSGSGSGSGSSSSSESPSDSESSDESSDDESSRPKIVPAPKIALKASTSSLGKPEPSKKSTSTTNADVKSPGVLPSSPPKPAPYVKPPTLAKTQSSTIVELSKRSSLPRLSAFLDKKLPEVRMQKNQPAKTETTEIKSSDSDSTDSSDDSSSSSASDSDSDSDTASESSDSDSEDGDAVKAKFINARTANQFVSTKKSKTKAKKNKGFSALMKDSKK